MIETLVVLNFAITLLMLSVFLVVQLKRPRRRRANAKSRGALCGILPCLPAPPMMSEDEGSASEDDEFDDDGDGDVDVEQGTARHRAINTPMSKKKKQLPPTWEPPARQSAAPPAPRRHQSTRAPPVTSRCDTRPPPCDSSEEPALALEPVQNVFELGKNELAQFQVPTTWRR